MRFQKLVLLCNEGMGPLIPACSGTVGALFYEPQRSGALQRRLGHSPPPPPPADVGVLVEAIFDLYDLSNHRHGERGSRKNRDEGDVPH